MEKVILYKELLTTTELGCFFVNRSKEQLQEALLFLSMTVIGYTFG